MDVIDIDRFRRLATKLGELRPILLGGDNAGGYLDLFDRFLEHNELGLALHAVCDYLLEPASPSPEISMIENILTLHQSMEIEDDCVDRLRRKAVL